MSIENAQTGKPSPCPRGEGCQEQTEQPLESVHRSGGVSGDGMLGREARVTQETCARGENASTSGTTSAKGEAGSARAGVRVPHSSLEAPESGVERRRGSCAEESKAERERGDGPKRIVTPTVPETAAGVRKLQRTLCRQGKSMGDRYNTRRMPAHEANRRTASESRMREIRPSGSMRGRRVLGSTKRASLLYLRQEGSGWFF
jgi:hypothetical protein